MSIKVSIIMNCYNGQKYLREALDSIFAQSFSNFELIFWDNQSTDNSREIVMSYKDHRLKYFYAKKHTSLGEARSLALAKCSGDFVGFLDTDDQWLTDKLKLQVNKCQDFNIIIGYQLRMDSNGKVFAKRKPKFDSGFVFKYLLKNYDIAFETALIKRNLVKFNLDFEFSPDYNLLLQLSTTEKIAVIKAPLSKYRVYEDSLTQKKIHLWYKENQKTLDEICLKKPQLKKQFNDEFNLAYAKVGFYKAKYLLFKNKKQSALIVLKSFICLHWKYFLVYLLCLIYSDAIQKAK